MKIFFLFFFLIPILSFSQLRSDAQREKEVLIYLDSAITSKDQKEIAEAYYRLAKVEHKKLNVLESNKNLYKSIQILERFGPSYELGRNYYWLGINANVSLDFEQKLKYLEKALEIHTAANSDRGRMICYSVLSDTYGSGIYYTNNNGHIDYLKAYEYNEKSLYHAKKINEIKTIKGLLNNKERLIDLLNGKENKHFVDINPQFVSDNPQRIDMIINQLDYASHLIQNNKMEEALKWISKCEEPINRLYKTNYTAQKFLSKAYADYYEKMGDYSKALGFLKKYHSYHTKVLVEDREGAISSLHILHETEKKETDLKSTQRVAWISGILLSFSVGLSLVLFNLNKKNRAINHRNNILVQEQNHRVKNNLQIISSLLNLQANALQDPITKEAIENTQLRISSMIHLHRQLYDNDSVDKIDMVKFISELTEDVLETYNLSQTEIRYAIEHIKLNADVAILIGLLINELITNSCKYALYNNPEPILTIALNQINSNKLELVIKDNGLEKIDLTERKPGSFGSKLIRMMVSQLNGNYTYTYSDGLEFKLKFNT